MPKFSPILCKLRKENHIYHEAMQRNNIQSGLHRTIEKHLFQNIKSGQKMAIKSLFREESQSKSLKCALLKWYQQTVSQRNDVKEVFTVLTDLVSSHLSPSNKIYLHSCIYLLARQLEAKLLLIKKVNSYSSKIPSY